MSSIKALSYLRVSGKGQIDGDGFPRQREAVQVYATAHGIEIVGEYRDEGISGVNELADRPGLAAALVHIEGNGVRMVIVENATRLARDLMTQEVILRDFSQLGVKVIDAASGYDLASIDDNDPTRTLIRQVLGAVSQYEKNMLVLKLRAARDRKRRETGRCEGPLPYGQDPERPDEVPGAEFCISMYREGITRLVDLVSMMNASTFRPRVSPVWNLEAVSRILETHGIRERKRRPRRVKKTADAA